MEAPESAPDIELDSITRVIILELVKDKDLPFCVEGPPRGVVPAALSHVKLPVHKPKQRASRRPSAHDGPTRKRRAVERTMQDVRGQKYTAGPKTDDWCWSRFYQGRTLINVLASGSDTRHGPIEPLITTDQAALAESLLFKAARQAGSQSSDSNRTMDTGNANFWAVVCSLEAFARLNPGGYVVPNKDAAVVRSWQGIEAAYDHLQCCEELMQEHVVSVHSTAPHGQPRLVRRSMGSHSFGNAKQKRKKIRCLDALLKEAGDRGICYDIRELKPPMVVEHDAPAHSLYASHKRAAQQRWDTRMKR